MAYTPHALTHLAGQDVTTGTVLFAVIGANVVAILLAAAIGYRRMNYD